MLKSVSTMDRSEILSRVCNRETPWDVIVIGGGATGVGCAVDAASRGYEVLLLEQSDFGKGTSSRSTKLVHGGVRYLEQGNISLIREALRERSILLQNAPHIVHRQEFVIPCYSYWQKTYFGVGLKIYDLLAGAGSFGRSKTLSKAETIARSPTVKRDGLAGGVLYYDGQFDDARLLTDLVTTAHCHGAAVLNYAKVASLAKDNSGRVAGVNFEDGVAGGSYSAKAAVVINATGAFCDAVRSLSDPGSKPILTLSRGIHLVFDRKFLPSDAAVMIPRTSDGRVLFCIPWLGHLVVGTTETPVNTAELEPQALESEIDFVLETVAGYLEAKPTKQDILSVFAGIRPLVKTGGERNTAALSRSHTIAVDRGGMLTITGGKWTTYREMAEDAIDQASKLGGLPQKKCVTRSLAIDPPSNTADTTERLHPNLPYTRADVVRAVKDEMAQTLEDGLARRTRALFLDARAAIEMAPRVAKIMADEMDKGSDWIETQVREFEGVAKQYLVGIKMDVAR